ncbi:MAG: hypothetical protein MUD10_03560 [Candidatus Pacebacteria bacterium]|jgi:hypothetical protein|nr:hypothetical protein [Candidatus Paceibacterota bacterium]
MPKNIFLFSFLAIMAAVFTIGVYFFSARPAIMCALGINCPEMLPATITIYCAGNNCAPQAVMAGAGTLIRGCYRALVDCRAGQVAEQASCKTSDDCVAATCCHPNACINANYKTVCNELCTQVCSGPLDCGTGSCQCIDSQCKIVPASTAPPGSI